MRWTSSSQSSRGCFDSGWQVSMFNSYEGNNSILYLKGPSWSWSYGSFIFNYMYLFNTCLSPLTLWVRILLRRGVLDTGWLFSPGTPVSSTNKTDCQDVAVILLKVALKHHNPNPNSNIWTLKYMCTKTNIKTMIDSFIILKDTLTV